MVAVVGVRKGFRCWAPFADIALLDALLTHWQCLRQVRSPGTALSDRSRSKAPCGVGAPPSGIPTDPAFVAGQRRCHLLPQWTSIRLRQIWGAYPKRTRLLSNNRTNRASPPSGRHWRAYTRISVSSHRQISPKGSNLKEKNTHIVDREFGRPTRYSRPLLTSQNASDPVGNAGGWVAFRRTNASS